MSNTIFDGGRTPSAPNYSLKPHNATLYSDPSYTSMAAGCDCNLGCNPTQPVWEQAMSVVVEPEDHCAAPSGEVGEPDPGAVLRAKSHIRAGAQHAILPIADNWKNDFAAPLRECRDTIVSGLKKLSGEWVGEDFDRLDEYAREIVRHIDDILEKTSGMADSMRRRAQAIDNLQTSCSGAKYPPPLTEYQDARFLSNVKVHVRPAWRDGPCSVLEPVEAISLATRNPTEAETFVGDYRDWVAAHENYLLESGQVSSQKEAQDRAHKDMHDKLEPMIKDMEQRLIDGHTQRVEVLRTLHESIVRELNEMELSLPPGNPPNPAQLGIGVDLVEGVGPLGNLPTAPPGGGGGGGGIGPDGPGGQPDPPTFDPPNLDRDDLDDTEDPDPPPPPEDDIVDEEKERDESVDEEEKDDEEERVFWYPGPDPELPVCPPEPDEKPDNERDNERDDEPDWRIPERPRPERPDEPSFDGGLYGGTPPSGPSGTSGSGAPASGVGGLGTGTAGTGAAGSVGGVVAGTPGASGAAGTGGSGGSRMGGGAAMMPMGGGAGSGNNTDSESKNSDWLREDEDVFAVADEEDDPYR
ncbi:hypothetical protein [Natronoglycomyces albus]|uniref:Uncharacterized protein n=1 Tax=Natronoglycomyces albus TaxID=2811108 RepID=A0A895XNK9_9ACTN|nr:hypothetical protein [Natronoglycomyces albus]QSB04086.1 hypothetical protein JQS30_09670 [Natronoglycomyces albus]